MIRFYDGMDPTYFAKWPLDVVYFSPVPESSYLLDQNALSHIPLNLPVLQAMYFPLVFLSFYFHWLWRSKRTAGLRVLLKVCIYTLKV